MDDGLTLIWIDYRFWSADGESGGWTMAVFRLVSATLSVVFFRLQKAGFQTLGIIGLFNFRLELHGMTHSNSSFRLRGVRVRVSEWTPPSVDEQRHKRVEPAGPVTVPAQTPPCGHRENCTCRAVQASRCHRPPNLINLVRGTPYPKILLF